MTHAWVGAVSPTPLQSRGLGFLTSAAVFVSEVIEDNAHACTPWHWTRRSQACFACPSFDHAQSCVVLAVIRKVTVSPNPAEIPKTMNVWQLGQVSSLAGIVAKRLESVVHLYWSVQHLSIVNNHATKFMCWE